MRTIQLLLSLACLAASVPINPKIYGVNLGGWLVLERWITPSLFANTGNPDVVDEWTYHQYLKDDPAKMEALRNHWDTWVTDSDIKRLKDAGITHVRLPVGFWSLITQEELDANQEPYLTGQWPYLLKGVALLKKHGIKAIIDLHCAPGSQNGWDNSGRLILPTVSQMVGFGQGNTIDRAVVIIEELAARIKAMEDDPTLAGTVIGIELLNEAFPPRLVNGLGTVEEYYTKAYPVVRKHLPADKYILVIEGAFNAGYWKDKFLPPQYENVYLDLHFYHCFDAGLRAAPAAVHFDMTCNVDFKQLENSAHPTFVGEWSVAWKTDSAIADTEPLPNPEEEVFLKQFAIAQMGAYDSWMFWNFKTESAPMWDYLLGVEKGWYPKLPSPLLQLPCGAALPTVATTAAPTTAIPTTATATTGAIFTSLATSLQHSDDDFSTGNATSDTSGEVTETTEIGNSNTNTVPNAILNSGCRLQFGLLGVALLTAFA